MTEEEAGAELDVVKQAVGRLMEHFETARVFVTRHVPGPDGGRTEAFTWGGGNMYAQCGQLADWLAKQHRRTEIEVDDEDDDE